MLVVVGTSRSSELQDVISKYLDGMRRIREESTDRPITFSGAFLCYRLRIDPIYASDHLEHLVSEAVRQFNLEFRDDIASYTGEGTDFLVTINRVDSEKIVKIER